jgi:hypothetical protein
LPGDDATRRDAVAVAGLAMRLTVWSRRKATARHSLRRVVAGRLTRLGGVERPPSAPSGERRRLQANLRQREGQPLAGAPGLVAAVGSSRSVWQQPCQPPDATRRWDRGRPVSVNRVVACASMAGRARRVRIDSPAPAAWGVWSGDDHAGRSQATPAATGRGQRDPRGAPNGGSREPGRAWPAVRFVGEDRPAGRRATILAATRPGTNGIPAGFSVPLFRR